MLPKAQDSYYLLSPSFVPFLLLSAIEDSSPHELVLCGGGHCLPRIIESLNGKVSQQAFPSPIESEDCQPPLRDYQW